MFTFIKALFIKELEDIIAPLDRIKANIKTFVQKQEQKIEEDADKIKELITANATRAEKNIKANTVIKNLETLLGA